MYHIKILAEADLIDATDASSSDQYYYIPNALTWNGHEFLDAIRNDTVWNKLKQTIQEKGGSIPFTVMQDLSLSLAKSFFGMA
jgi:predicted transcriptional regulator